MNKILIWISSLAMAGTCVAGAQHTHGMMGPVTPLSTLVAEALSKNSQVASAEHAWRASTKVAAQVTTLPDPQFTVQEFSVGSPKPFAGFSNSDFAYVGIGMSQDLPFAGKLRLRGQAAERDADEQKAQIELIKSSLADQIKTAYLRMAYLHQTVDLLNRNSALLEMLIQTELGRYKVGQGSQADVLRGQLERTRLLRETTMHEQEMQQIEVTLKLLSHRPQDSASIVPEAMVPTPTTRSKSELIELVRSQNPMLQDDMAKVEQQNAKLNIAKRDTKPDFNVGGMFQQTGLSYRDYYVATLNVRLPRLKRVRAGIDQAAALVERSEADADADLQQQLAEVERQWVAAESASELMQEYRDGLIPQAETIFQSELTAYQSDREKLSPVLSALMDRIAFEHDFEQALLDHETAIAHLETLTGVELR